MCLNIKFGINIDAFSKDKSIVSTNDEDVIISYLVENPNLFTSFKELGIKDEDVFNPEFFIKVGNDMEHFSEQKDVKLKLVNLYRYVSDDYGPSNIGSNSRRFCVELAKRSNVAMLPFQSITSLNSQNPGQGPNGSNTYSIFDWRGGAKCKHYWVKYLYDTQTQNLVKAPIGQQPTQVGKGRVPNLPK
jgi:hypothetical protein